MRKCQILGIELMDYTMRESMRKVDEYLRDGKVSAIGYVTTKGLMEANEEPRLKEWMQGLDLTIAADVEILHAAGIDSTARLREVEENLFIKEFLKKLARGHRSVFVLAETREQLGKLTEGLLEYQENLQIVGTYAMEELQADEEYVVNEINIAEPDVLLSQLPSPRREDFFESSKMKLNPEIWLMLKEGMSIGEQRRGIRGNLYDKFLKKSFWHRVMRFKGETDK